MKETKLISETAVPDAAVPCGGTVDPEGQVDIASVVDNSRLGSLQILVLTLCALVVLIDGFDVQLISFVAPVLAGALHVDRAALGPVFGAGLAGTMLGAFAFSPLADRYGRKATLMASVLLFALCSLATMISSSMTEFYVWRFIGGLGLGGATPIATALAAEFCPKRSRPALVMTMYCGFSVGAAGGGVLSAYLIPVWGWPSVFLVGGLAPMILIAAIFCFMPESPVFLVLKGTNAEKIGRLLRRIDPRVQVNPAAFIVHESGARSGFLVRELFRPEFAKKTVTLWIMFISNILSLYFLVAWFPTLIHSLGLSLREAVLSSSLVQAGSIAGTLLLATVVRRFGAFRLLAVGYLGGGVSLMLLSTTGGASVLPLPLLAFVAGFFVIGTQTAANAVAAIVYPTEMRSTGIGWALGVGRIGSVVGPMAGGALIGLRWEINHLFILAATPALIAAVAAIALSSLMRGDPSNRTSLVTGTAR